MGICRRRGGGGGAAGVGGHYGEHYLAAPVDTESSDLPRNASPKALACLTCPRDITPLSPYPCNPPTYCSFGVDSWISRNTTTATRSSRTETMCAHFGEYSNSRRGHRAPAPLTHPGPALSSLMKIGLYVLLVALALGPTPGLCGRRAGARATTPTHGIVSRDPNAKVDNPDRIAPKVTGTDFLIKFGYLPQSDLESGALRTEEELARSLRHLQAFANLPQTGVWDNATARLMQKPRCGVRDRPDVRPTGEERVRARARRHRHQHRGSRHPRDSVHDPQQFAFGPSKWKKTALTFRILNYTPDLDAAHVRDAIIRAFYVWSDVTLLTFHEIFHGKSDIEIKFARGYHSDGYPFDGPGLILAHAFFPGEDRGGDVHFDDDELWTQYSHDGTNLYAVAAHEIGHALGLAHSSVPGSLMYPWYQGFTKDGVILHSDDIVAIQYLYGVKYRPDPGPVSTLQPPRPDPGTRPPPTPRPPLPSRTYPTTTTTTSMSTVTDMVYTTKSAPTDDGDVDDDGPLDPCEVKLDAVALIRGEVFAFKNKWFWRRDDQGIMEGYPVEFSRFWYGFPTNITHVDAVYERPEDGKIVFFQGRRHWIFNGNYPASGFPVEGRSISELGFPEDITNVDAAFVWGHNQKTYFVTGDMYWRYNEFDRRMDNDYPRDMTLWGGVPTPLNGAFKFWDGRTYFFQGDQFWAFNDARMHVRSDYPQPVGPFWLGCTRSKHMPPRHKPAVDSVTGNGVAIPTHHTHPHCLCLLTLTVLHYILQLS